jgi:hypothetical protein
VIITKTDGVMMKKLKYRQTQRTKQLIGHNSVYETHNQQNEPPTDASYQTTSVQKRIL